MTVLHEALGSLSLTEFSSVPSDQSEVTTYLQNAFQKAQTILDSVPIPPPTDPLVASNFRSTASALVASNVSEISSSSARSDPLDPSNVGLQKEWGKPVKFNAKDNPLGIAVYKCAGKDGKGAWFGRRSVHEGLSFKKFKLGLQSEFPETMKVQGAPGEGNIRGIGGERRVERIEAAGKGAIEVYHLSAQFPGPTAPRDFVTLLITSSSAMSDPSSNDAVSKSAHFRETPRHFMVISKPCIHTDCPPRDGFIRGQYESVEFIREVPKKRKLMSSSTSDLLNSTRHENRLLDEQTLFKKAEKVVGGATEIMPDGQQLTPAAAKEIVGEGRKRGQTISFAPSQTSVTRGEPVDIPHIGDEDDEINPVEWIMITRSDPGGSVPRFMVERGTPAGILGDASKFLDWACKKEHTEEEVQALEQGRTELTTENLKAYETNAHLTGLDGSADDPEVPGVAVSGSTSKDVSQPSEVHQQEGILSSVAGAAFAGIEAYAPQAVVDRLPGHKHEQSMSSIPDTASMPNGVGSPPLSPILSDVSSVASFASAEDHFIADDTTSLQSTTSQGKSSASKDKVEKSPHERELLKLEERKRLIDGKLAKAREKQTKDKQDLTSKETERIRKTEEKHAREIQKNEEKYKKEIAKLEAKRQKESAKLTDRKKRAEDRDEKARLTREKAELRQQLEIAGKERDILRDQVGALQRENTSLVVRLGKLEDGKDLLKEVKSELDGKTRSRSSSLMRGKGSPVQKGKEATVLSGEGKKDADGIE